MGRLVLPSSGEVYADAQIPIYTTNAHPVYAPLVRPMWEAVAKGTIFAASSELTLLESLVGPLRSGDTASAAARENLWRQKNTRLIGITEDVLREAARLRAIIPGLKTPDAIHAATALVHGCVMFITNDMGFRRVPNLPLVLLDDVLAAP